MGFGSLGSFLLPFLIVREINPEASMLILLGATVLGSIVGATTLGCYEYRRQNAESTNQSILLEPASPGV